MARARYQFCYICGFVVGPNRSWSQTPPLIWTCNFRAIVFDESQRKPFLSGVGHTTHGTHLQNNIINTPCSRTAHYKEDNSPPKTVGFNAIHPYLPRPSVPVYGYLVHKHCWTFLEQQLGSIADDQLTSLSNVLELRWKEKGFQVAAAFDNEAPADGGSSSADSDISVTDPYDIPEVDAMIKRCLEQSSPDGERKIPVSEPRRSPVDLPQELKNLILDNLDFNDVRNTLTAFGWVVDEGYCQSRFRKDLFFEIERYPNSQLNWHTLWRESEALLGIAANRGLNNREQILKIVKSIESEFRQYQQALSVSDTTPRMAR
ncbi:hypothetical protein FQN54_007819 [Arachnomyces sp. PD_36]|nr:hypothetical protein FQN54_007819 [Arachnomyces sp. PD_36]